MGVQQSSDWLESRRRYHLYYDYLLKNSPDRLKRILPNLAPLLVLWFDVYFNSIRVPSEITDFLNRELVKYVPNDVDPSLLGKDLFTFLIEYMKAGDHPGKVEDSILTKDFESLSHREILRLSPIPECPTPENLRKQLQETQGFVIDKGKAFYSSRTNQIYTDPEDIAEEVFQMKSPRDWITYFFDDDLFVRKIAISNPDYITLDEYQKLSKELQQLFPEFSSDPFENNRNDLVSQIENKIQQLSELLIRAKNTSDQADLDQIELEFTE